MMDPRFVLSYNIVKHNANELTNISHNVLSLSTFLKQKLIIQLNVFLNINLKANF